MRALLVTLLLLSLRAEAASLRPLATIDASVVRLSDLFDDAGSGADRVLGAAPAPGSRLLIEAPQLAAIARQFGVDWRPASPADHLVIDRPGRVVPREAVLSALRAALTELGVGSDL